MLAHNFSKEHILALKARVSITIERDKGISFKRMSDIPKDRLESHFRGEWDYQSVTAILRHPIYNRLSGYPIQKRGFWPTFPSDSTELFLQRANDAASFMIQKYMIGSSGTVSYVRSCLIFSLNKLKTEKENYKVINTLRLYPNAIAELEKEIEILAELENNSHDIKDWLLDGGESFYRAA